SRSLWSVRSLGRGYRGSVPATRVLGAASWGGRVPRRAGSSLAKGARAGAPGPRPKGMCRLYLRGAPPGGLPIAYRVGKPGTRLKGMYRLHLRCAESRFARLRASPGRRGAGTASRGHTANRLRGASRIVSDFPGPETEAAGASGAWDEA